MAEAIIFGVGVSLLQEAILVAFGKLKTRFQQAKATEGEFREVEVFLRSIQDCCKKYDHTGGTVTTTTTTTTLTTTATTPNSFAEALKDVQKNLEEWSSQNSRFFSESSADRVKKLQALRRQLKDAIKVENFRMTKSMYHRGRNNDGQTEISQSSQTTIETSMAIDDPHGHNTSTARVNTLTSSQVTTTTTTMDEVESSSQVTTMTTTTDQVSTHLVQSNTTRRPSFTRSRSKSVERDWPSTIPGNLSPSVETRSKSVEKDRHHSSEKDTKSANFDHYNLTNEEESTAQIPHVGEKGRTEEFWVPLDSEKQRRDMKKRLKLLPGVKSIFFDLDKKVWVDVGEGSNVDTDTLLREMLCAWPKYKTQKPTLWSDRPDQPKAFKGATVFCPYEQISEPAQPMGFFLPNSSNSQFRPLQGHY